MAYFANSSEGDKLDIQCSKCKYGQAACPIAIAQMLHNYDACGNDTASEILRGLIHDDGTCSMWKAFQSDFEIDPNQTKMFK